MYAENERERANVIYCEQMDKKLHFDELVVAWCNKLKQNGAFVKSRSHMVQFPPVQDYQLHQKGGGR